jgi:hypothetical protein
MMPVPGNWRHGPIDHRSPYSMADRWSGPSEIFRQSAIVEIFPKIRRGDSGPAASGDLPDAAGYPCSFASKLIMECPVA